VLTPDPSVAPVMVWLGGPAGDAVAMVPALLFGVLLGFAFLIFLVGLVAGGVLFRA